MRGIVKDLNFSTASGGQGGISQICYHFADNFIRKRLNNPAEPSQILTLQKGQLKFANPNFLPLDKIIEILYNQGA
jgi:hypothetical protein